MKHKTLKRLISVLLTIAILTGFTTLTTASQIIVDREWDGVSELIDGQSYTVSSSLLISGNITIPQDTMFRVVRDGELILTLGSKVDVYGDFRVSANARLFTSGEFTLHNDGIFTVSGAMQCSLSSKVSIGGAMSITPTGEIRTSGEFNITTGGNLTNNGEVRYLNSASGRISGIFSNHNDNSLLRIAGSLSVATSGNLINHGTVTITDHGRLVNSGRFTIHANAHFYRLGAFSTTANGQITDHRTVDRWLMSPQAIEREPATVLYGIDVSRWQGDINWQEVGRTNIEFAMLRIGVGSFMTDGRPDNMDRRFREYIAGAQANGIEVGVYWYSYAQTVEQIKREAHYLVSILGEFRITYPVVLDMEEARDYYIDSPSDMADAFLEIIMAAGYFPMLYSFKSWLENNVNQYIRDKYTIWVAHWYVPETTYKGNYHMWQYTDEGRVSGISGNVDLNIAYRDFAAYITRHGLNRLG